MGHHAIAGLMNVDGDEEPDQDDPPTADYLQVIADMLNQIESAIVSGENEFDLKLEQFGAMEMGLEYWSRHLAEVIRENQD